jgi:hypothetical protein
MATIPLPMLAAARDGKADTLRDLLQHGIEGTPCLPDACNVIGQTCLHFAAIEIALCRGNQGWRPEPRKASELAGLHVTVTPPFHLNLTCTCTVCVWCVSRGSAAGSGVCFEVGCVARDALRASWGGWGGGGLG